ncbi:hypothetical protein CCHL11_02763 [Colletotrichum chlorophyti]|uniref:Uncharacterized protein n=1 Tax=Colletotrichum chlorophyti TaxID=708187 RepID=A0A1Q8S2X5_9PEZI|nr:hypothetical protein CCHL11_02763 [Colletotrichum chlorophyti]
MSKIRIALLTSLAVLVLPNSLWPPKLFTDLLSLLVLHLEHSFYHAHLCSAYHLFSRIAVIASACLNFAVRINPSLQARLANARTASDIFNRLDPISRALLRCYLAGIFLLPNLLGPICTCWFFNPESKTLDDAAHLYGFLIGSLHLPLALNVSRKFLATLFFSGLRSLVQAVLRLLWPLSYCLPPSAAAATQRWLGSLHAWFVALPGDVVSLLDRRLLRAECVLLRAAVYCTAVIAACTLYSMVIDAYRPYLLRLAITIISRCFVSVGGLLTAAGLWVDNSVVQSEYLGDDDLQSVTRSS